MGFGKEMKRLRLEANKISVQKIADTIGVDADRWRKWEAKDLSPRSGDMAKIEAFFGLSIAEIMKLVSIKKFLTVQNKKNLLRTTEEALADDVDQLKALSRAFLHQIAKLMANDSGRGVEDCMKELEQNTKLILKEMQNTE